MNGRTGLQSAEGISPNSEIADGFEKKRVFPRESRACHCVARMSRTRDTSPEASPPPPLTPPLSPTPTRIPGPLPAVRINIAAGLPFTGERPTCDDAHLVRHPETPEGREDMHRIVGHKVTQLLVPLRQADPIRTVIGRPEALAITVRQLYNSDPRHAIRSDGRCWVQVTGVAMRRMSPGIENVVRVMVEQTTK